MVQKQNHCNAAGLLPLFAFLTNTDGDTVSYSAWLHAFTWHSLEELQGLLPLLSFLSSTAGSTVSDTEKAVICPAVSDLLNGPHWGFRIVQHKAARVHGRFGPEPKMALNSEVLPCWTQSSKSVHWRPKGFSRETKEKLPDVV